MVFVMLCPYDLLSSVTNIKNTSTIPQLRVIIDNW